MGLKCPKILTYEKGVAARAGKKVEGKIGRFQKSADAAWRRRESHVSGKARTAAEDVCGMM